MAREILDLESKRKEARDFFDSFGSNGGSETIGDILVPGPRVQEWLNGLNNLPYIERQRAISQATLDGTISELTRLDIGDGLKTSL